jgi:hypothetical protein
MLVAWSTSGALLCAATSAGSGEAASAGADKAARIAAGVAILSAMGFFPI